jgi:hypothetical protein
MAPKISLRGVVVLVLIVVLWTIKILTTPIWWPAERLRPRLINLISGMQFRTAAGQWGWVFPLFLLYPLYWITYALAELKRLA